MPVAIPIIAAVTGAGVAGELGIGAAVSLGLLNAGIGLSAGAGIFLGSAVAGLAGFVVSTAINAIGSRAFAPKNKAPNLTSDSQSQAQMVQSTVETHKVVYGEAKLSGPIVFIGATDSGPTPYGGPMTGTNLMLHLVVALAGHKVDSIGTVYLNDKPITLAANGFANCIPYSYYPPPPAGHSFPATP